MALIIVSATGQKNVRQKNKSRHFSVLRNMKGRPADSNLELATLKIINSKEASNE
jgi:hypothetical protein